VLYIYFIYGLSFFSFGLAILLYPKRLEENSLLKNIWLLGLFGIVHGATEWIEIFKIVEPSNLDVFNLLNFILIPISFLFLFYFGLVSLIDYYKKLSYSHIIIIFMLWAIIPLLITLSSHDIYLTGNIYARYLLAIPATFLTAYRYYLYKNSHTFSEDQKRYLLLFSITFLIYGFLSGFIVPAAPTGMASIINTATFQEYIGLPIQLFRATCAFILAYISIALLRTSRLEVESQLIQLSKALEVSGDSVIITDRNGIILYTNPAFEQQTGFTKEEAYGKTPVIIKSGAQQQSFYEDLWVTILNGDTFRSYIINKKKDGELYYEYKAIAPITNNKGQIVSFVSTGKDVTEHMLLEQKYEQLASVDTLTEIANRMKFDEVLKYSVDRAKRYNIELSVILFDIDNFKKVNDTYGHLIGDDVLKKIVQIGKENIRESDLIARWGGEEFMILQTDIPSKEALVLAERLRQAIESHIFKDVGKVTASFGVATFRNDEKTDSFLKRVDDALYSAKTSGKNKVVVV